MEKSPEAFRTISEVADWLDVPTHVLRFWESRFKQVKPVKRAGGRRYYRPSDMALIGGIKALLHDEGMTIRGVQKLLREKGIKHVAGHAPGLTDGTGQVVIETETDTAAPVSQPTQPHDAADDIEDAVEVPETIDLLADAAPEEDPEPQPDLLTEVDSEDLDTSMNTVPATEPTVPSLPDLDIPRVDPEDDDLAYDAGNGLAFLLR
ncbi:MAG: MerR family transcriptional regulator, partial [Pseudomonadota bacterium]